VLEEAARVLSGDIAEIAAPMASTSASRVLASLFLRKSLIFEKASSIGLKSGE
jgi:hypothetical protein